MANGSRARFSSFPKAQMQPFSSLQESNLKSVWLTIGSFDGVHIGHQKILKDLVAAAHADGAPAVLLTFDPHPVEVLRGPLDSFYLSSHEEKAEWVSEMGVDALITHPFNLEVSQISAQDFVQNLKDELDLKQLWIGHDFTLGHNREGDISKLQQLGAQMDFSVQVTEAVQVAGGAVSSSRIRKLVAAGDVKTAQRLLGRPYTLTGEVVRGEGRGSSIGIPTANLGVWPKRAMPDSGVYAGWAEMNGKLLQAVTNIGVRPTFEDQLLAPVVESHLLDYDGDEFYGEELRLHFVARLREEKRFSGVDELLEQIQKDIQAARKLLAD
jgi:riboflavin kinase/FMN adenylyltransferase